MTLRLNTAFASAALSALLTVSGTAQADTKTRTTSFDYDAVGLLSKTTSEPLVPNDCLQVSYGRDVFGNPTSTSTAACPGATGDAISSAATPRTSTSSFGTDGRFAISSSNALNQSETKAYNLHSGTLASLTGPNGLTTSWLYDSFKRKTKETRADGTYTTWAYKLCTESGADCPGPIGGAVSVMVVIEQSYAANAVVSSPQSRTYLDALGRTLRSQTQGFDGQAAAPTLVADTEYNARGQVARQSNRYVLGGTPVWTSFTYDVLGRVTRQDQPDPDAAGGVAVTSTSYNALSFTLTNSKSQTKTTTKNSQGLILQVVDNAGSSIVYSYDALGQLTQTNAAGSITSMSYNQRGNKIAMLDPVMGAWDYRYNVFGELVGQTDSGGHTVAIAYDVLGRMTQRTEADLVSDWSYDKKFDGTACGKGIGKLCEAKAANGYVRKHTYDNLGRPSVMSTVLDNPAAPAVVTETYDVNTGRVASKTWPSGYQASYQFSPLGYLKKVTGGGTAGFTQTVSYEVLAMNPQGQVTQYRQGNQVTTVKNFNATSNRLTSQTATKDGQAAGNVLNHSYTYDSLDNLTARTDTNLGTQESFSYDSLNRLSLSTILGGAVSPPTTTEVMYDARGNISYKSDVGRYWYDAQRPNRMTNVTLESAPGATIPLSGSRALSYAFDDLKPGARNVNGVMVGNGNLEYTVSHDTVNNVHTVRSETYTSFNMPAQIQYGNFITTTTSTMDRTLAFVYGPEHQRIKQQVTLSGSGTSSYFAGSTWYLNGEDSLGLSYEKEIRANGTIEQKHYVSAGGQVFALFTSRSGTLNGLPATSTSYMHQDHLSSVSVITDETGAVVERMAYDPWGKRRRIDGTRDKLDLLVGVRLDRGYTMHEHLDEVGIIHMNGRIYDPLIGRFMSADPYVQVPTNLKTFNRYSYVWNNPLKSYDPNGFGIGNLLFDIDTQNSLKNDGGYDQMQQAPGTSSSGSSEYCPCEGRTTYYFSYDAGTNLSGVGIVSRQDDAGQSAVTASGSASFVDRVVTGGYGALSAAAARDGNWGAAVGYTVAGAAYGGGMVISFGQAGTVANSLSSLLGRVTNWGARAGQSASVWSLPPFQRGVQIEQALGQNLPSNFPMIDRFENGLATSIKSMNLDAASYGNLNNMARTLSLYINTVSKFVGASWAGVTIPQNAVTARALDLVVPTLGNAAQQNVLGQAVQYGASVGVAVNIIVFP
jgi:RHS repeat-associated protein